MTDGSGQHIASNFLAINERMQRALYAQNLSDYIECATKALSLAKQWQSHVQNARILEAAKKLINIYEIALDKRNSGELCLDKVQTILEKTYEIVTTC